MFTGIVQNIGHICALQDHPGLRTIRVEFPAGFGEGLNIGASVAVDGVCLTVVQIPSPTSAVFDIIQQSLQLTTLADYALGTAVNIERAAKEGAEIGGHHLSGHVDFATVITNRTITPNNHVLRLALPPPFAGYVFAKGYIAINGASLTVAEVNKTEGWFEVWLIPETLRATVFAHKYAGDKLNIEIERTTQVVVDTVHAVLAQMLGPLKPALDILLAKNLSG